MPRLRTALGRIDRALWRWPSILVIALLWSGGLTIGVLLLWAAESQDRLAAKKSVALLYNVLDERRYQLGQLARDYSWWDEAAVNLVLSPDADWAASNIGPYLSNAFQVAASLVLDPDDKQVLGFLQGVPRERDLAKQLEGGIARLADEARKAPPEAPVAATGFLRLGDDIHVVAASLIVPGRADLRDAYRPEQWAHVLVLTQSLDDDMLESIGGRYGLTDLSFRRGRTSADASSILLVAPDGQELGSLTWKAETPGIAMLRRLLLPVALAFDVMVILAILIVRQIGRMNRESRRKNAELEKLAALQTTMFDAMTDGIAVLDADLCLASWNRAFAEICGYPPELLKVGTPLVKLLRYSVERAPHACESAHGDVPAQLAAIVRRDTTPTAITLTNGQDVEVRRVPLPDGGVMMTYRRLARPRPSKQLSARPADQAQVA